MIKYCRTGMIRCMKIRPKGSHCIWTEKWVILVVFRTLCVTCTKRVILDNNEYNDEDLSGDLSDNTILCVFLDTERHCCTSSTTSIDETDWQVEIDLPFLAVYVFQTFLLFCGSFLIFAAKPREWHQHFWQCRKHKVNTLTFKLMTSAPVRQ